MPVTSRKTPPSQDSSARAKVLVALAVGVAAGVAAMLAGAGESSVLIGWDAMAVTFCLSIWRVVWPLDAEGTASHSLRENPGRRLTDLLFIAAGLASLVAVGLVLVGASGDAGVAKFVQAALTVVSVFVSWTTIHTVFMTQYARLYYEGTPGGVDFNEDDPPDYHDFAYLAFTVGMTFQISDTALKTKTIRRTTLRHALVSFPLGTVIIAATINLVSGLAK